MSTQSAGDESRAPAEEVGQKNPEDPRADGMEDTTNRSPASVFVNSEPMREDQVQNAVNFLSHPRVRGSPVIYRRSFLEKKGLAKEEIDEAFRRVPDSPPSTQTPAVTQEGQVTSSNIQQQAPIQALQPATTAPGAVVASVAPFNRYRFHWYHTIVAIGILAGSGAGTVIFVKRTIIPRLKSWIRAVVLGEENDVLKETRLRPSLAEETTATAKAAAAAAVDVAKASEELLNSKLQEKKLFGEIMKLLDVQLQEMKSISVAVKNLQGQANSSIMNPFSSRDIAAPTSMFKQPYSNGKTDWDYRPGRSSSPQASMDPSSAPHSKSYMEIMSMVQRGERPPNIKDIDDSPPNPNQQISNPRVAPRMKPWEVSQAQKSSNQPFPYQLNSGGVQYNGFASQSRGIDPASWQPTKNLRNAELEKEDGLRLGTQNSSSFEPTTNRSWVPPLPPPVAMLEAAEAIRRPKPLIPKEQVPDEQKVLSLSDATAESAMTAQVLVPGVAADDNGATPE